MLKTIEIETRFRTEMINIDHRVQEAVQESGISEGICLLWNPHTTAALTINENADPSVVEDILRTLNATIPFENNYRHVEGNSAAHIKSSLFGPSLECIVTGGCLLMGTWQSIFFCEFDGPRRRRLHIKVIEG